MIQITDEQINEGLGKAYKKAGHNAYFGNGFEAGVRFTQELVENLTIPVVMPSLLEIDFLIMRKEKGLTLREVTKLTGISDAYLSQLETGKIKSPGYNTVKALYELYSNEA
jgi:DNA-binding Xre family transcriptional regulator